MTKLIIMTIIIVTTAVKIVVKIILIKRNISR